MTKSEAMLKIDEYQKIFQKYSCNCLPYEIWKDKKEWAVTYIPKLDTRTSLQRKQIANEIAKKYHSQGA